MDYLVQPRGPGTAWQFRMKTPKALIGRPIAGLQDLFGGAERKPDSSAEQGMAGATDAGTKRQTAKDDARLPAAPPIFAATIKRGLGTSHLPTAKKLRDEMLGAVRRLERAMIEGRGEPLAAIDDTAIQGWVEAVREQDRRGGPEVRPPWDEDGGLDEPDVRQIAAEIAEGVEQRFGRRPGVQRQVEKFRTRVLRRDETLGRALEQYLEERAPGNRYGFKPLALASANDTRTSAGYLAQFMKKPADALGMDEIGESEARRFADEFLAELTTIRSPRGLSHKTIAKHETMLAGLWAWAIERRKTSAKSNPWLAREKRVPRMKRRAGMDEQWPGAGDRTMYQPEEARKLLVALPRGTRLGDLFRLALVTGCRVDEIAKITTASLVHDEPKDAPTAALPIGFMIASGKTENARRFVPVPEIARSLLVREPEKMRRRASTARDLGPQPSGRLFPEFPIREASGKAAAASQEFTRERRKALGEETDGRLSLHSTRHTWRTMARRAGVPEDVVNELGGWAGEKRTSAVYDHGMAREQLNAAQEAVVERRSGSGYTLGF